MSARLAIGFFLAATLIPCLGAPAKIGDHVVFILADGEKKEGKISRIDIEGISLLTDDGGCRVLFSQMKPADQATYHYDPEKVAVFDQKETDEESKRRAIYLEQYKATLAIEKREADQKSQAAAEAARFASRHMITGQVLQIVDGGALLKLSDEGGPYTPIVFIRGLPVASVNILVSPTVIDDGTYDYTTLLGEEYVVSKFQFVSDGRDIDGLPPVATHIDMSGNVSQFDH